MPFPDGSSTASEVGFELNRLLVAFRPNHKPGEPLWDVMCVEYADALRRFSPAVLHAGISKIIAERKEKFWPTPAEIIEAVNQAPMALNSSGEPRKSFSEIMRERDDRRRRDTHDIIDDFQRQQAELYRIGASEGWASALNVTVTNAARMIALRNEARANGLVPSNPAQTSDGGDLPNIGVHEGEDYLVIRQEDIAKWRSYLEPKSEAA